MSKPEALKVVYEGDDLSGNDVVELVATKPGVRYISIPHFFHLIENRVRRLEETTRRGAQGIRSFVCLPPKVKVVLGVSLGTGQLQAAGTKSGRSVVTSAERTALVAAVKADQAELCEAARVAQRVAKEAGSQPGYTHEDLIEGCGPGPVGERARDLVPAMRRPPLDVDVGARTLSIGGCEGLPKALPTRSGGKTYSGCSVVEVSRVKRRVTITQLVGEDLAGLRQELVVEMAEVHCGDAERLLRLFSRAMAEEALVDVVIAKRRRIDDRPSRRGNKSARWVESGAVVRKRRLKYGPQVEPVGSGEEHVIIGLSNAADLEAMFYGSQARFSVSQDAR